MRPSRPEEAGPDISYSLQAISAEAPRLKGFAPSHTSDGRVPAQPDLNRSRGPLYPLGATPAGGTPNANVYPAGQGNTLSPPRWGAARDLGTRRGRAGPGRTPSVTKDIFGGPLSAAPASSLVFQESPGGTWSPCPPKSPVGVPGAEPARFPRPPVGGEAGGGLPASRGRRPGGAEASSTLSRL